MGWIVDFSRIQRAFNVRLVDVVMDSPLCTQRARGSNFLPFPEFEANSCPCVQENMSEEPESGLMRLHREEKLESTAEVLIKQGEVPHKDGDQNKWGQGGVNFPLEMGQAVYELARRADFCVTSANAITDRPHESENITDERREKKEELQAIGCLYSSSGRAQNAPTSGQSSELQSSASGFIGSERDSMEPVNDEIKRETDTEADKVASSRSYILGYFAGKLSKVYKDTSRTIQGTRDIIQNVPVGEMKVVLSRYVSMMSKEIPLIHRIQLQREPEPRVLAEKKVSLVNLSRDGALRLHQNSGMSAVPGVSGWPEGSVASFRDTSPQKFYQRLVELPLALARLQTCTTEKILEKLESLSPQMQVGKLVSVFWLKTADRKKPIPRPACLLLSEKDIVVVSASTDSTDDLTIFHRFNLLDIKEVQISLAGQHVRLIGTTEDPVLAVFTHSKELTQEFCKALLKDLCPDKFSEGTEGHPLLSDDLMAVSLDWTSNVPDIILDSGLRVTSRFKRVLADLLYIIHGNMEGPGKPSLANVCPLLYTSVKVKNFTRVHQDAIFQFLLTDTHVALLQEDGVFHPVPRGSSLVPSQPQFQGLEVRKRSDIRCLLVKQNDDCLVVEIAFTIPKPQTPKRKAESRRSSAELPSTSNRSGLCNSWKLSFGCTSEAQILINHLCV
ncbi:uncharacterized protein [Embiotoca jacksoni]|uniref:uncharacterized protein n=1 Tax=Embiotoca jacksoni TaxID=100190 RepID=UPI0037046E9E